ncbi:MAG: glycyl-radical enzyme activating protein [Bacteroidia bacterium]|nr:glycyl-radical enzyme activating protein [Bacteroidia bacterium]
MKSALIFDIKPYSINDGPGIRITIFLKGCPLSCAWCHNPEGISPYVQKLYSKTRCIACGTCVENCPKNALVITAEGVITDTDLCDLCGLCAGVCPTKAMEMSGSEMSVEEIMGRIRRETVMMDQSAGGVTISGGEPMMQSDFLIELLDALGREGIHRAVDTTGFSNTRILLEVAKRTDLFLFDLKMMDTERHKKFTGVSNEKILENLRIIADAGAKINIRIPLIKGVNADENSLRQSARFVASLPGEKRLVSLLPYHNIAIHKYSKLGQEYEGGEIEEPSARDIEEAIRIFGEYGLEAGVGG